MKRFSLYILSVLLLSASCVQEKADSIMPVDTEAPDFQGIQECHQKDNPYPSQISARIEGTWVWEISSCPMVGQTQTADKHVVVTFNDGGLYKVYENSQLTSEGEWSLNAQDGNWTISTTQSSTYLNGFVYLCGNELLFMNSYLDGCDYYFTRQP